jgi:preprotein translocase subunit YajC
MSSPAFLDFPQASAPATDATTAAPSNAPAQAASESPWGGMLVPLVLCMVVFYFFMIAPERKQRKKREEMLSGLQKGMKVMTTGGLYGTIAALQDQVVTLQIADGVRVRYAQSAIQSIVDEEAPATDKDAKS